MKASIIALITTLFEGAIVYLIMSGYSSTWIEMALLFELWLLNFTIPLIMTTVFLFVKIFYKLFNNPLGHLYIENDSDRTKTNTHIKQILQEMIKSYDKTDNWLSILNNVLFMLVIVGLFKIHWTYSGYLGWASLIFVEVYDYQVKKFYNKIKG